MTKFSTVWERETAKRRNPGVGKEQRFPGVGLEAAVVELPQAQFQGKVRIESCCVFVVDMCSTRDFHVSSWRNFPSCQREPPPTLWKQEINCKAQKLVRFNQWEIQHSNTLNMEEQQKHSKKRSGMSESCTSSFPRIKKTEQVFCLFFYFIKKTHKNPLGPRVHLHS